MKKLLSAISERCLDLAIYIDLFTLSNNIYSTLDENKRQAVNRMLLRFLENVKSFHKSCSSQA